MLDPDVYLPMLADDEEPADRFKIQAKFDHGRFTLPVTISPGTGLKRSFCFLMTPDPQRLVIRGRVAEVPVEAILELKPPAVQPGGAEPPRQSP